MKEFGAIVARVMKTLPKEFQPYIQHLVVDVEEEPEYRLLRHEGFTDEEIEAGDTLLGIFMGMYPPGNDESIEPGDLPSRIVIFKRPLEDAFPDRRELMIEIRKTVIHELAHHYDFTERDLEKFDNNPDPFKDERGSKKMGE
jgi:predicted Zn-dependent protease with MMP-like domain